jgi:hypothetical protein
MSRTQTSSSKTPPRASAKKPPRSAKSAPKAASRAEPGLTARKSTPTEAKAKRALAPAFLEHARELHAARLKRLAKEARALVEQIKQAQRDVAGNLVEMGLALVELKAEGMATSLGCADFEELCRRELSMSPSTARRLMMVATRVSREVVLRVGQSRALALLELVEATPEDDTPEELLDAKLALPSGKTLVVAEATAEELRDAAREIVHANQPGAERRKHTSRAEQAAHRRAGKQLEARGFDAGKLLAGRGEKTARVRYEVPVADLRGFAKALLAATDGQA